MRKAEPLLVRVPVVWGSFERTGAKPDLQLHENALYLPADGAVRHRVVPAGAGGEGIATAPDGLYIVLDEMVGHYGHFIVDVLSRLWPMLDAPGVPVRLVCEPANGRAVWERYPFVGAILAGLGLGPDAVVGFEEPVVLPRAAVAARSFVSLECVHDVFGDLCRRAGRGYWSEAEVDTLGRPAYLAKARLTTGMHSLVNEGEVVEELDRLGADIVFPESMSFPEQVREIARRRVLIGPVGSAFHTTAFSAPARRLIGLSGMLQLNSNHVMFDAINGNQAYYYYVSGMRHGTRDGFGLAWTIPRPKAVAAELMRRAEHFERIDALDGRSGWRAWAARAARWRDRLAGR